MNVLDPVAEGTRTAFGQWIEEKQSASQPRVTDSELARRIGITRQHLGVIKKGASGTRKPVVISIANALGADPNEACDLAGYKGISPDDPEITLARSLHNIMRDLPPKQRRKVEDALKKDAAKYVSLLAT